MHKPHSKSTRVSCRLLPQVLELVASSCPTAQSLSFQLSLLSVTRTTFRDLLMQPSGLTPAPRNACTFSPFVTTWHHIELIHSLSLSSSRMQVSCVEKSLGCSSTSSVPRIVHGPQLTASASSELEASPFCFFIGQRD